MIRILMSTFLVLVAIQFACHNHSSNRSPNTGDISTLSPFYVYSDAEAQDNKYYASGWMGDYQCIENNNAYNIDVYNGETCQKWTYKLDGREEDWAGVVWQDPENNWEGDIPDSGYNLDSAILLVFAVKGENGNEIVSFGLGGLEGQYPDSVVELKKEIHLTTEWTEVSIYVENLDLSRLHNGFMWLIDTADNEDENITFYLDDIRYVATFIETSGNYVMPGVCFSPFTYGDDPTQGDVATANQVKNHMEILVPYTKWIRTYGTDGGLADAGWIAHELDLKIAMGAWIERNHTANNEEVDKLIDACKAGEVDIAVIGNEVLHRRDLEPSELIELINNFKAIQPDIPVTTAEVHNHWIEYPELIDACDVIYAQIYPFWDGLDIDISIAQLNAIYNKLCTYSKGKEVVISETGWPSNGEPLNEAVPSSENAFFYFLNVASWAHANDVTYFYFEAFDEPFKAPLEPNDVGDQWGIFTKDLFLKEGMSITFNGHKTFDNWVSSLPGGEGDPAIEFTYVPPIGSYDDLQGQVLHVWPTLYGVAVYIYVYGGWWTKPYWDRPLTWPNIDGTFTTDITTGGVDHKATYIAAFLVPAEYDTPLASGGSLPSKIQNDALASIIVKR